MKVNLEGFLVSDPSAGGKSRKADPVRDFKEFLLSVDGELRKSAELKRDFVEGKDIPLYEIAIQSQKAKISLELLVKIRDEALKSYKQIITMNI